MWFQAACLLLASVLHFGLSERYISGGALDLKGPEMQKPVAMGVLVSGPNIICGGPEIWSMLTSGSDASSVENIKWAKIDKYAEEFITSVSDDIKVLELDLHSLEERVQKAKMSEQVQVVNEVMARELIISALDSFDGYEQARLSKCGKPTARPRARKGAYKQSQADFERKAEEYFKGGFVRLDGELFLNKCKEMLLTEDSYCGPLCQKFKDKAQEWSDAEAGESTVASDALLKRQVQVADKLKTAKLELSMCIKARASLEGFKTQLLRLQVGMNQRFDELQEAEYALDDAQFDLSDFETGLEKDEERLAAAEGAVAGTSADEQNVRNTLEAAKEKEKALHLAVLRLAEQLANVRSTLEVAKNIDKVVSRLKMAVSLAMESMRIFRDKAVLDPLRRLGFSEDLPLDESFPEDPMVLGAAGKLGGSMNYLQDFCKEGGEAKLAFAEVQDTVDLFPLCSIAPADELMDQMKEAIEDQMGAIKERITKGILSEFNPYKGNNGMTMSKSARNVEKGELRGLQEIVGPYHKTLFYREYLKNWKLKGPFLTKIAKLTNAIATMDQSLQALADELQGFENELREAQEARKLAADALEQASKAKDLALTVKSNLEQQVLALREEGVELSEELDKLHAAVAQARERYLAARGKLVIAHKEGTATSMLALEAHTALEARALREALSVHRVSPQQA